MIQFELAERALNMDVILEPELKRFVEEQVKAGRFATEAAVLEAGLAR